MTTQELIEENKRLRERAALWKRCAKHLRWETVAAQEHEDYAIRRFDSVCRAVDKAEAELAVLKKAARMLAEYITDENTSRVTDHALNADVLCEAACRILEATKED